VFEWRGILALVGGLAMLIGWGDVKAA